MAPADWTPAPAHCGGSDDSGDEAGQGCSAGSSPRRARADRTRDRSWSWPSPTRAIRAERTVRPAQTRSTCARWCTTGSRGSRTSATWLGRHRCICRPSAATMTTAFGADFAAYRRCLDTGDSDSSVDVLVSRLPHDLGSAAHLRAIYEIRVGHRLPGADGLQRPASRRRQRQHPRGRLRGAGPAPGAGMGGPEPERSACRAGGAGALPRSGDARRHRHRVPRRRRASSPTFLGGVRGRRAAGDTSVDPHRAPPVHASAERAAPSPGHRRHRGTPPGPEDRSGARRLPTSAWATRSCTTACGATRPGCWDLTIASRMHRAPHPDPPERQPEAL